MQRTWILWMIPFALVVAACAPAARTVPAAEPVFYAAAPLVVAACAPAARTVPAAEPVFYAAAPLEIMGAVIEAISTAPGVDDSTGWLITDADTQGGFVRAETEVTTSGGLFHRASTRSEWLTVVVTAAGENRSQVIVQNTGGAVALATRVRAELQSAFGLN